ncbi:MAG: amino acid ABC transporter permease [Eubacterium sp.]|nr:amino acid ABC transporter permease [Eubacterium sp.]
MDWEVMASYLPLYQDALLLTLKIGWMGVLLAFIIGIVCTVAIHLKAPVLRQIMSFYIELFRNTPLLVQLFFFYFAFPKIGIRISAQFCGSLGLGLLGGAYMAETFRSGLENIAPIQSESAQSLGMDKIQAFWYVILPQAVSSSIPGLLANVIFLLKETSVFSTISLMDLMFTAKDLIGMYAKTIECLTLLVIFYLIMLLPVSILGSFAERRLRHAEFGN